MADIDTFFDFLTNIVARGSTLSEAHIVEGNQVTCLPLEAFDGAPMLADLHHLEAEWTTALSVTLDRAVQGQEQFQHRLAICEKLIVDLELGLSRIDQLRQRLLVNPSTRNQPILQHFQNIVSSYEGCLHTAHKTHARLLG